MSTGQSSWNTTFDRVGIWASAMCFVHCLVAPVVLSLSAVYAHFLPSEEHTHRALAVCVTIFGAVALVVGYRRHNKKSIIALMMLGLTFISTGAFYGDRLPSHWYEVAITMAGSCCMIVAHRLNHTFCRRCETCT
jgi:uncharacterized membrane protein YfcA